MPRLGLRAHDFGRHPPEVLAEKLEAFGPACVQLALAKAFPDAPDPEGIEGTGYPGRIRDIFEARGMAIAVLGCYINPVHPDRGELERQLARFEAHLRFAGDFGCPIVGTETGSLNPDSSYHPGTRDEATFDRFCVSIERLVRAAEGCGTIVGIEPVADQHTVSSIDKTRILIERIDSPALGIIFDPVNLIPVSGLRESQPEFFARAFEAFGRRIAVIHAKDFRMENGRKSGALAAGMGDFDYPSFFRLLRAQRPGIDVLLENTSPSTAAAALGHLAGIAAMTG